MKKKGLLIVLIILSFLFNLGVMPLERAKSPVQNVELSNQENNDDFQFDNEITIKKQTSPDTHLTANVLSNGGFEENDSTGMPYDYSVTSSPLLNVEFDYQPARSGSYAANIIAAGSHNNYAYSYLYQNFASNYYLYEILYADSWYNLTQNPDLDRSNQVQAYFSYTFSGASYKVLRYIISYSGFTSSNSSTITYFLRNSTYLEWHNLNLNLTSDFDAAYGPNSHLGHYLSSLYIYVIGPNRPTGNFEMLVDDVSITNNTGTEIINNGGFESGSTHWFHDSRSTGYVEVTELDYTEGNQALNLTVANEIEGGSKQGGYAYAEKYYTYPRATWFCTEPGSVIIDFYWKVHEEEGKSWVNDQYAELLITIRHPELPTYQYRYLHIILVSHSDGFPSTNTTDSLYIASENFGTRDTWVHERIDLYDIFAPLGFLNASIYQVRLNAQLGKQQDSKIEFLVDNFNLRIYPLGDPGFEQDWHPSYTFTGWYYQSSSSDYTNKIVSYDGTNAANISAYNGLTFNNLYRSTSSIWLEIAEGIEFDFWWRLQKLDGLSATARVYLNFEGGKSIYYMLGGDGALVSNSSSSYSFYVKNSNTTNTWINTRRNLYDDLTLAFGSNNWNLTSFYLSVHASGSDETVLNLDDINFIYTGKPTIESVHLANTPTYNREGEIEITCYGRIVTLTSVTLTYRADGGSWSDISASYFLYHTWKANVPIHDYGTEIEYYITATDRYNNIAIDNNGSVYYRYTVGDDINPLIKLTLPYNNSIVKDSVLIQIDASDAGSDINYIEIYAGLALLETISVAPYEYTWDTRTVSNGSYDLLAIVYDNAGNSQTLSEPITIFVANDVSPPLLSGVQLNPLQPADNQSVIVSVGVYDQSSLENISLYYKFNGGDWSWIEMEKDGSVYSAIIPPAPREATVYYYIEAYDVYLQKSTIGTEGDPLSYTVTSDVDPPTLSAIQLNPSQPKYDQDVTVTVGVIDQSEIDSVVLYYKIGEAEWTSSLMIKDLSVYSAIIPSSTWNTEVLYYIVASDIHGHNNQTGSEDSPLSYIIIDNIVPELSVNGPPVNYILSGDMFLFTVNGTDAGSGIAIVEIEFNGTLWSSSTVPQYWYLNTTTLPNGNYTIVFRITDNAGNIAEESLTYQFNNPEGFFAKSIKTIDSVLNSYWGMLVGAGGVMTLAGTGFFISWRIKVKKAKVPKTE